MATFHDINKAQHPPAGTVIVPPRAFASSWDNRPNDDLCCGVRALSEADLLFVKGEASKLAWKLHPEDEDLRIGTFNDALMRLTVARGTCDPNDASASWETWEGRADDIVNEVLTTEGTRLLYDAIEAATIATSPVRAEATDEQIATLLNAPERLAALPSWRAKRVRRLLCFCIEQLGGSQ